MDYLFNLFLLAIYPVALILVLAILLNCVVLPLLKNRINAFYEKPTEGIQTFTSKYKVIKRTIWLVALGLIITTIAMKAISPSITAKNTTYDPAVEDKKFIEQFQKENEKMSQKEITLEGARMTMEKTPEETKKEFYNKTDYTKPMYPSEEKTNSK